MESRGRGYGNRSEEGECTMALTKKQIEGIEDLFVTSFVNSENELDRKKILIQFEDTFGKSIGEWKGVCREKIEQCTSDESIIAYFDKMIHREGQTTVAAEYTVRMLEEADLEQVREIINASFGMCLTVRDDEKLKKFVESGYSVVACSDEEIVGVALAFEMPDYNLSTIYLDTFAVSEHIRGCGIGKKMFGYLQKLVRENIIACRIRLQTDRKIDAYQIYKHWGLQEDDLVHMRGYIV